MTLRTMLQSLIYGTSTFDTHNPMHEISFIDMLLPMLSTR